MPIHSTSSSVSEDGLQLYLKVASKQVLMIPFLECFGSKKKIFMWSDEPKYILLCIDLSRVI